MGSYKDALECFRKTVNIDPWFYKAFYNKAVMEEVLDLCIAVSSYSSFLSSADQKTDEHQYVTARRKILLYEAACSEFCIEREFTLEITDRRFGTDGTPTLITIRQASETQKEFRSYYWDELLKIDFQPSLYALQDFHRSKAQDMNYEYIEPDYNADQIKEWAHIQRIRILKRIDISLTLVACNIPDEMGKPLFKFRKAFNRVILDMSEDEFQKVWSKLPDLVQGEIHSKVLQINSDWKNIYKG